MCHHYPQDCQIIIIHHQNAIFMIHMILISKIPIIIIIYHRHMIFMLLMIFLMLLLSVGDGDHLLFQLLLCLQATLGQLISCDDDVKDVDGLAT